jgi:hypothetical protein
MIHQGKWQGKWQGKCHVKSIRNNPGIPGRKAGEHYPAKRQ